MLRSRVEKEVPMDYHVMVVGCGGTGGNFIKEFTRFLYNLITFIVVVLRLVIP